ncbi:MAG: hypothetical protein CMK32_07415 [Porticoccaceae bacterium]|nr:hypothetical protein [Porticoccaceae bacterium]
MDSTPAVMAHDGVNQRVLLLYLLYRLLVAALLAVAFTANVAPGILGKSEPGLFQYTVHIYGALALVDLVIGYRQHLKLRVAHLFFVLLVDLTALTLLMHASAGLNSGIGYLMFITVAAGSIFFYGQLGILIAAIASICIILQSALSMVFSSAESSSLFPAGLLGGLLFLTALLFQRLNIALRRAQLVASQESEQSAQFQELNRLIISRMLTGVIVVDHQNIIQLINQSARELLGDSGSNKPLSRGDNLKREPQLARQLAEWQRTPWFRSKAFIPCGGDTDVQPSFKQLDQPGNALTIIFLEDFRAATQQAQQLKLASLGRLTGSIAHEIRNPLGAISHAAQLLSEFRQQDSNTQRLTDIIDAQVKRVNQIIENVLQLSRRHDHNWQPMELRAWLEHFTEDYCNASKVAAEIEIQCNEERVDTYFDPSHLHQVLTNLVDNGIRYSHEETERYWVALRIQMVGSDHLPQLDVIDRGPGVTEKDRSKLFEPFFTTSREGSGLGLYIAHELCEINHATLKYQPPAAGQPGYFRITFAHPGKLIERRDHD